MPFALTRRRSPSDPAPFPVREPPAEAKPAPKPRAPAKPRIATPKLVDDDFVQPSSLGVGRRARHPSGRLVKITNRNPASGHWMWREILKGGKLGELEEGPDFL